MIQVQTWYQGWSEAPQQMPQGTPTLAATHWVLAHLCGRSGSQAVVRVGVRPAEFIRAKQTKIWLYEVRAHHQLGM